MKYRGVLSLIAVLLVVIPGAVAQNAHEFSDPSGQYKLALIGDWRAVSYDDAVGRQKTEFVYRDRSEGLLKITREALPGALTDAVRQDEENLKIYRSGFERSSSRFSAPKAIARWPTPITICKTRTQCGFCDSPESAVRWTLCGISPIKSPAASGPFSPYYEISVTTFLASLRETHPLNGERIENE